MTYNDTSNRKKANNFFWHLRFDHIFLFICTKYFFLQKRCVLFKKYFPTKSFGVWNGPRRVFSLFRHIRGIYVVTEKNNRLGKDLRRIKENNYRATDTNAIRNHKEVIAKKRKYGDTVNFCLMSTFLFRIQLFRDNFKLKLRCLWVSCFKGGERLQSDICHICVKKF